MQLSNGKIIVVERDLVLVSVGDEWAANLSGSKPKERYIRLHDLLDSKKIIEWHSIKNSPQRRPEIPLILDNINGVWVVFSAVAKAGGCLIYNKYIYQNDVWVEEKLAPTFGQRETNLYIFQNEGLSYIDLNKKRDNYKDIRNDRFVQVGPTHPNCNGL